MLLLFACALLCVSPVIGDLCKKCSCGKSKYNEKELYITNCTYMGFNESNITDLRELPEETEVFIFKGNNVPVLHPNIFGNEKNFSNLKVIDMTDNKIEEIKGKAFHHVPMVERLILNHNSISITNNSHPRVFSNFENLKELHLTDAFLDYNAADIAEVLHSIFINSNLKQLVKLHLEQNEIQYFADRRVFCDLENLMDLHLGNNKLENLHFDIECLPHLRYLDIEGNNINHFTNEDLLMLDSFPSQRKTLIIDIHKNPFFCECKANNLYFWLKKTGVKVKNNETIQCHYFKNDTLIYLKDYNTSECYSLLKRYCDTPDDNAHIYVRYFLFSLSFFLIIYLITLSVKYSLEYCRRRVPTGKVHYVVIRNSDENQEVHV